MSDLERKLKIHIFLATENQDPFEDGCCFYRMLLPAKWMTELGLADVVYSRYMSPYVADDLSVQAADILVYQRPIGHIENK